MILKDVKILDLNKPLKTYRIYPKIVFENWLNKHISNIKPLYGHVGFPKPTSDRIINVELDRVSHFVTNIRIIDEEVIGDIHTLNTFHGLKLEKLLAVDTVLAGFRPRSYINCNSTEIDDKKYLVVNTLNIISIDYVLNPS